MFIAGRTNVLVRKEAAGRLDKSHRQSHTVSNWPPPSPARTRPAIMVHICAESLLEPGTILRALCVLTH